MAVQQATLFCDQSTYANFFQWASVIDIWFATNNWIQTNDTGQWMRSGMSITAVSMSGTAMTCTYSSLTGAALQVGQALTVTGWTAGNVGNNGTFVITGLGAGTWTATNAAGVNVASSGTGVVTQASTVPGSGAQFNSFWQPNDGLTNFIVRMGYGNVSGQTNNPQIYILIGVQTNGAGGFIGATMGQMFCSQTNYTVPGTGTAYDCRFTASAGRIGALMWRLAANNATMIFSIERSLDSSGAYTGQYVTMMLSGPTGNTGSWNPASQQTLLLTGASPGAPYQAYNANNTRNGGWTAYNYWFSQSGLFNGYVPFSLAYPYIGYFDYPQTNIAAVPWANAVEGMVFTATVYGNSHTYIMTNAGQLSSSWMNGSVGNNPYVCMRYD